VSAARTLLIDGREVDLGRLADICRRFGIVELAVFGSTVRDQATTNSDIDLLYVLSPDRRLGFAVDRLEDALADRFGRRVDLVSKKSLHRLLRDEILSEARTLYAA
jgi:predicted nucleotidyltransferase